jgi:RNA polymerase sigma-70 factor (ECF subfamily)
MLAGILNKKYTREAQEGRILTSQTSDLSSDLSLVKRIVARDEDALRELYGIYGQRLYAYALHLTGVPATAEDVVQEVLIIVWKNVHRFRAEGRLLAWLLGIAHHTAMKSLRHSPQPITDAMETTMATEDPTPEEKLQKQEQAQWVQQGMKSLSPDHRAVLELIFYQGLSLSEAAQVCNCPPGTIKSRLNYARKHLRGILNRREEAK